MNQYGSGLPPGLSSEEDTDDEFELSSSSFERERQRTSNYFVRPKTLSLSPVEELFEAVKNGNLPVVKDLINRKIDVNSMQGVWPPLMFACFHGYPDIITTLLDNGANINFHKEFFTPLMAVCSNSGGLEDDRLKCVEILLQHNVSVNASDRFRSTPLMLSSREGQVKIVKKLIERGADLNKIDKEGWSAIFHAVNYNKSEVVDVLIQAGANLEIKDIRGRSLHDLAIIKGFEDLAEKVNSKKEINEPEAELFNVARLKTVQQMLSELPSRNTGINSGFPSDVYGMLQGMNMDIYIQCFYKNNIQLGEFLVITNERLKEIGVKFSAHRQKILQSIKRFHLYRWQKSSIGLKARNEKMELLDGLKLVANSVRQLHVIQSSLFYLQLNKPKAKSTDEFKKIISNAINQTYNLQKELITLQSFAQYIDSTQIVRPVDLIKQENNKNGRRIGKYIRIGFICFFGGVIIWKSKESWFSFFKIKS